MYLQNWLQNYSIWFCYLTFIQNTFRFDCCHSKSTLTLKQAAATQTKTKWTAKKKQPHSGCLIPNNWVVIGRCGGTPGDTAPSPRWGSILCTHPQLQEVVPQQDTYCTFFTGRYWKRSEPEIRRKMHTGPVLCPPSEASSPGGLVSPAPGHGLVPLGNQQPEHDDQCHEEEEPGQELLIRVLWCPWGRCGAGGDMGGGTG